jgi:hypothetical protein
MNESIGGYPCGSKSAADLSPPPPGLRRPRNEEPQPLELVSDEAVEAAAHVFAEADFWMGAESWEHMDLSDCLDYRRRSRTALEAAAPIILARYIADQAPVLERGYEAVYDVIRRNGTDVYVNAAIWRGVSAFLNALRAGTSQSQLERPGERRTDDA